MKQLLYAFLILFSASTFAYDAKEDVSAIYSLVGNDPDSAFMLCERVLKRSEDANDLYGLVKANLILGYLLEQRNDYAKSVIYYLEGIRRAESGTYEKIDQDKIWLRRNIANVFRDFDANRLATQYNLEAIEIAINSNNNKQLIDLKFNQALVYQNSGQPEEAINYFLDVLPMVEDEEYNYRIINQVGLVYLESKEYENAKGYFEQLLNISEDYKLYNAKALLNLGEILYESGDRDKSIEYLRHSINMMESETADNTKYHLFISFRNIGRYLFELNEIEEAEIFLNKAEEIASFAEKDPNSFELYKILSSLHYTKGNNELGSTYSETYFSKVNEYIETQDKIQKENKEYNFDLITKRYFDEVEKQERISSILFYSKLTSGSLLSLLLLVIGYHRYEKIKLRRTIEQELVSLKVIE